MNKSIIFLYTLLFAFLLALIYLIYENHVLTNRLETIGNYIKKSNACTLDPNDRLEIQKFKEDSYIRQQEHDTTLILTVFAILIGFVAAVTYIVGQERITSIKNEYDEKISKQEKNFDLAQKFLEELRSHVNYEAYLIRISESHNTFKSGDKALGVFIGISALSYYSGYYYYISVREPSLLLDVQNTFVSNLKTILINIGDNQLITFNNGIRQSNMQGALNAILKLNNPVINDLVIQIQARLRYS